MPVNLTQNYKKKPVDITAPSGFEKFVMNTDSTNGSQTFIDDTGNTIITSINGCAHSTNKAKFGATSARFAFPVSNSFLQISSSSGSSRASSMDIGTNDFTFEMWIASDVFYHTFTLFMLSNSGDSYSQNFQVRAVGPDQPGSNLTFFGESNLVQLSTPTAPLMDGNWHHIALTRQSGTGNLWVDGSLAASGDFSGNMVTNPGDPRIGLYTSGNEYPGYIDSIRLEVGYVRYTAPFTPPTVKFTV